MAEPIRITPVPREEPDLRALAVALAELIRELQAQGRLEEVKALLDEGSAS